MRNMILAVLVSFLASCCHADDLTKIDRKIGKEPAYKNKPEYGLLLIGPKMERRVWIVRDGDMLYIDKDGSGDLTSPSAKFSFTKKRSTPEDGTYIFESDGIDKCQEEPVEFTVYTRKLSSIVEEYLSDSMKKIAKSEPDRLCYQVSFYARHPVWKGKHETGRVQYCAGITDHQGFLLFGSSPDKAPVMHAGGKLQLLPRDGGPQLVFAAGQTRELPMVLGTPGLGDGTTMQIGYEKVIPESVAPVLEATFKKEKGDPVREKFELKERC